MIDKDKIPKTCILCKEMRFDPGEQDWSEVTPGCDWSSHCSKNHWHMGGDDTTVKEYGRLKMLKEASE